MSESNEYGCREYNRLSRRRFLSGTATGALLASTLPAWLPKVAFAQDYASGRDVIVSIYLRGGVDGLTLCVPHGENAYYTARPNIAIPRPGQTDGAIDLDGFFGFPPAMGALADAYRAGHLLVVHATGSNDPSRSHFDAQRFMEVGKPRDAGLNTGWLGRHLASVPPLRGDASLRALGIATGLQQTLQGAPLALPIPNPASFGLTGSAGSAQQRVDWLGDDYGDADDAVKAAAQNTINTFGLLQSIGFASYQPGGGAVYPNNGFGNALRSAAALIKAQVGVEAIQIDLGGWDTHSNQGPISGGMAANMRTLAGGIAAFHRDVFSGSVTNVTLVAVSEFGRTVRQNTSQGTDHGHGNALFVLGQNITGGRVLRQWPGLGSGQLYQNQDLQVTIDYRDVLAEVVQNRLGTTNLSFVFPDYAPRFRGVTRA